MSVTNVYRRAEDIVYELVYSSDSIDAASFQSESKGEIYKIETENVDNLTVSSNPPIGFMINNKDRYSCEIVRAQLGTQSIVRLFAKQLSVESLNTAIPTNFGEGRYLYVVSQDENCCYKFDSSLLVPGNYEGSGIWTVNPLVATIQLPTITDIYNSTWQFCFYEKSGDIVCIAGSNGGRSYGQVCRIKPNNQVWNLDNTIQNSYTNSFSPNTFTPIGLSYDYEKNIAYVRSESYLKGIKIDLNINTSILHQPNNSVLINVSARNLAYMPSVKRFFSQCEIDYENDRNYSQLTPSSSYGWSLPKIPDRKYSYYSGVTICNRHKVDSNQNLGGLNDRYNPYGSGVRDCVGSPNHNIILAIDVTYQSYSIVKANSDTSLESIKYWMADINNFPGGSSVSRPSRVTCCDYSKLFFAIIDDAVLGDNKRLLVIDPDNEVQPDFGYYSMPSKISHFSPNQLL